MLKRCAKYFYKEVSMSKKINFEKLAKRIYKSAYFKITTSIVSFMLVIIFGFPALVNYFETREPFDISGEWKITFEVNESSYNPYIGNKTTYKIYFFQKDREIIGDGESWEFNTDLNYNLHKPITFNGKIIKDLINSNYTLYGENRTTYGKVQMNLNELGNYMEGTFSGTGAAVKGTVSGEKL